MKKLMISALFLLSGVIFAKDAIQVTIAGNTMNLVDYERLKEKIGRAVFSNSFLQMAEVLKEKQNEELQKLMGGLKKTGLSEDAIKKMFQLLINKLKEEIIKSDDVDKLQRELLSLLTRSPEFARAKQHFESIVNCVFQQYVFMQTIAECSTAVQEMEQEKKSFIVQGKTEEQFKAIFAVIEQDVNEGLARLQEEFAQQVAQQKK